MNPPQVAKVGRSTVFLPCKQCLVLPKKTLDKSTRACNRGISWHPTDSPAAPTTPGWLLRAHERFQRIRRFQQFLHSDSPTWNWKIWRHVPPPSIWSLSYSTRAHHENMGRPGLGRVNSPTARRTPLSGRIKQSLRSFGSFDKHDI